MTSTRRYDSPVRQAKAEATRAAILEAFARQLGRPGATDVSVPEAAEAAGVSIRTVYHHFPDRESRVVALAAWADEVMGPVGSRLEDADDLPQHVRLAYARAARHLDLTRAMYVAGLGGAARELRLVERRKQIHDLLAAIGAPEDATRRAAAVVALLATSEAGIPLVELHGLTIEEAGEAAAEAVAAVVADLRRRA